MRVLRCGEGGALVELASIEEVHGLLAELRDRPPAAAVEYVPAARTLLVRFDPARTRFDPLADDLRGRPVRPRAAAAAADVEIPVRYDGEDLDEVAERTGLEPQEVSKRHRAGRHAVAFCGFAPGFGYISGLDPRLHLPRRATPRTRVPAGSVAIADAFTGIYPRPSPGGWWIIGHTDRVLWDLDADPPAVLVPGSSVQFTDANP